MNKEQDQYIHFSGKYLGSVDFIPQDFTEKAYKEIECAQFRKLSVFDKHEKVNRTLLEQIQESDGEVYLLPKVVAYITRVREIVPTYVIGSFEFWLNHFSGLSEEEQNLVRAKIVGKHIPRRAYQKIFPLGLGNRYKGPHFSFAHFSPDLDTIVASFHCFLAAFGSRIASSRHHWIVPGGPPQSSTDIDFIFKKAFGKDVFNVLSCSDKHVQISSLDLLTQANFEKKGLSELVYDVDHARSKNAVVLVGENGCYLSDWRDMDVDQVQSIVARFWRMITDHQNSFHIGLISLFAKPDLKKLDLENFSKRILSTKFADCSCSVEFSSDHRKALDKFLKMVVGVKKGFSCTYLELLTAFEEEFSFGLLKNELTSLSQRPFFNSDGLVLENRGLLFLEIQKLVVSQKDEYKRLLRHFDTLNIAHKVKRNVLGLEANYLSHLSEIDQIQKQMNDYSHLTVNYKEGDDLFILGVIHAADIKQKSLATASWNDFSNPLETDARSEIEVISYVDHHKSDVQTVKPATGIVMDAQSSNSIYANLLMEINDQYSTGGMTLEEVEEQIKVVAKDLSFSPNMRILQRLLNRKEAFMQNRRNNFYVSKDREILEYLQCVYAILDDTDLLTKVTGYDVKTMCSLINRLKSLMLNKEVEVVNFDNIEEEDKHYVQKTAKKLLQTRDLYSIYSMTCSAKEAAIEEVITDTVKRGAYDSAFFQDTKILNQYACVGQHKHFIKNASIFNRRGSELNKIWTHRCKELYKANLDLKLFIFMISTISSAEELFSDKIENPTYKDEVWFWLPENDNRAESLFKKFVSNLTHSYPLENEALEVVFHSKRKDLVEICEEAIVRPFDKAYHKLDKDVMILKVPQKKLVSRKGQISPHL